MYGPVGIFLMDIRGNRITGDGVQHSDNTLVSEQQWQDFGDKSFGRVSIYRVSQKKWYFVEKRP